MALTVEIDTHSGFCGGVIRAINTVEEYLAQEGHDHLFSLGDIVHNEGELSRLSAKGLVTIDHDDLAQMPSADGETLLIRAHGEPPSTYSRARNLGFQIIDCTCPVVLKLQKSIRDAHNEGAIVIFGKIGHPEVLGLVGQVDGDALVVENISQFDDALSAGKIPSDSVVELFSQTTKSPEEYDGLCAHVISLLGEGRVNVHYTICSQVAHRHSGLMEFARSHDVVVFVAGKHSSNGKVLCDLCRSCNIRTYLVGGVEDIRKEWFHSDDNVGVSGGTSTPGWLLSQVADAIAELNL